MRRRRRPFPVLPRLATQARTDKPTLLVACPRVSPEWELSALDALMRPQRKETIAHRSGKQTLRRNTRAVVESIWQSLNEYFGELPEAHFPAAGDYAFIATFDMADEGRARSAAIALSSRIPDAWFAVGALFLRGGQFFRRERRYKLRLIRANDIHLSREHRTTLRAMQSAASRVSKSVDSNEIVPAAIPPRPDDRSQPDHRSDGTRPTASPRVQHSRRNDRPLQPAHDCGPDDQ